MEIKKLNEKAKKYSEKLNELIKEIKKIVVGQEEIIKKIIISLIADGHILLEGVPGLAKTLIIKTIADSIKASFCRIQFTPDLLPADIIGTKIYDHNKNIFYTEKGPIFHNFILADEINRAPPKVQSALLEAMQEKQVSIHGETFKLNKPFLVLATQNPIEQEGTYHLPEAQVDRFALKLIIKYPKKEDEIEIMKRNTQNVDIKINQILNINEIKEIQKFVKDIYVDEKIMEYIAEIINETRKKNEYVEFGASPRASIWLILTAKANALLEGRGYVISEDIKKIAYDVLRHRIILTYEAEAEEITTEKIIEEILNKIKCP